MSEKLIAANRAARHDYHILETVEAGLVLFGPEVKTLRSGRASLVDSFAKVEGGEVFLYNVDIPLYASAGYVRVEPRRVRKLLLHDQQIARLGGQVAQKGLTLVPLRLYFKHGIAKIELALAKGKKEFDKRDSIRKRETEREMRRRM